MHPPSRRELLLGTAAVALAGCAGSATRPPAGPAAGRRTGSASPPSSPAATGGGPAAPAGPATEVVHGPRDRPQVALTFHGSGDPALARRLLSEVERAGARVTVFAVGQWLDAHPELARRVLDGGHGLANH
ncbi:MAG TPA: polysaccharide deacetylase family protein, partial [Frankiaceae bacterium]|nr:polysaccharide deacetylase family protein [Frankiaceae bacterium]